MRKCRADFGVEIDIDPTPIKITKGHSTVHCVIGNVGFEVNALKENLVALVSDLNKAKPASAKGIYLQKVSVSSTMGPGVLIDHSTLIAPSEETA